MKRLLFTSIIVFLFGTITYAQIGVFPQAVFLDAKKNRSANMKIFNNSNKTQEIIISMFYGYPGFDSNGKVVIVDNDSTTKTQHSAVEMLKIFPQKLLLKGKEEQTIRLFISNTADIKEGTYFARIRITSKEPAAEIDTTYIDGIQARLELEYTMVAAAIVEIGKPKVELEIKDVVGYIDSTNACILVDFERGGNSPFFGTTEIILTSSDGKKIADNVEISPIYFSGKKLYVFKNVNIKEADYKVKLKLTNEHKDVPDDFKIPFKPLEKEFLLKFEKRSL